MGAGGCSKRVAEFTGPGVRSLPMDARTTICNCGRDERPYRDHGI